MPMAGGHETFDRSRLRLQSLSQRRHEVALSRLLAVGEAPEPFDDPALPAVAEAVAAAHGRGAAVLLILGAHVIKQGLSRYVIDLIRRRWVTLVAGNGACAIHDYELARIGATSESVARYIADGRFGLWRETSEINDIVARAARERVGFGEAVGRAVLDRNLPHRDASIFAAACATGLPATVHVGIGYDILHEHPNFDPAAAGEASYRDFLIFARAVEHLAGGAVLCFGSAVMGPEVFLKALAMARNVAHQSGRRIGGFTTAVFDLLRLPEDLGAEPPRDDPAYYYRPYKTLLVRTVAEGGRGLYVRGDHRATLPALHEQLRRRLGP
jgi:hypothetical protein